MRRSEAVCDHPFQTPLPEGVLGVFVADAPAGTNREAIGQGDRESFRILSGNLPDLFN